MARVCGSALWPAPAPRLCPSQLDRKRGFAGVVVESRVWHGLRDIQRRYGLYGACDIAAAVARQPVAARCDAAIGLWHLPVPLRVHHLDAIFRLRPGMARRRQGGHRVRRYAWRQLAAYGVIAKEFRWWRGRSDSHGPAASWRTMRHCMANTCIKDSSSRAGPPHVSISRIDVVRARSMLAYAGFGRLSGSRHQDRGAVCAGRRHRCGGADAGAGDGKGSRRVRHHREQAGGGDHSRYANWSRPARPTVTRC